MIFTSVGRDEKGPGRRRDSLGRNDDRRPLLKLSAVGSGNPVFFSRLPKLRAERIKKAER